MVKTKGWRQGIKIIEQDALRRLVDLIRIGFGRSLEVKSLFFVKFNGPPILHLTLLPL